MEMIENMYSMLLTGAVTLLAILIIVSLIRSVLGPGISDRIIAVNMIGTMIIMVITILSVFLDENYLVDICLIYAMISFLGVVVLCKVYTGVYLQKKQRKADLGAIEDNVMNQVEKQEESQIEKRKESQIEKQKESQIGNRKESLIEKQEESSNQKPETGLSEVPRAEEGTR